MKGFIALLLFVSIYVPCVAQQTSIDSLLRAANKTGVFNGVALVAKDGKAIFKEAYGYTWGAFICHCIV